MESSATFIPPHSIDSRGTPPSQVPWKIVKNIPNVNAKSRIGSENTSGFQSLQLLQ